MSKTLLKNINYLFPVFILLLFFLMTDLLLGALRLEMRPISTYLLLLLLFIITPL